MCSLVIFLLQITVIAIKTGIIIILIFFTVIIISLSGHLFPQAAIKFRQCCFRNICTVNRLSSRLIHILYLDVRTEENGNYNSQIKTLISYRKVVPVHIFKLLIHVCFLGTFSALKLRLYKCNSTIYNSIHILRSTTIGYALRGPSHLPCMDVSLDDLGHAAAALGACCATGAGCSVRVIFAGLDRVVDIRLHQSVTGTNIVTGIFTHRFVPAMSTSSIHFTNTLPNVDCRSVICLNQSCQLKCKFWYRPRDTVFTSHVRTL